MENVLITDDCHPVLLEELEAMGFVCHYQPDITNEETRQIISAYSGLVINSKILVDGSLLDAAPRLRFVARLGSGLEIIDREAAARRGVAVISSPEGNRNAVAEQALGMLLALATNLIRSDTEVRKNLWRRETNRGFELRGRTLGIMGYGHTGSQFAKKLAGMDMRVLAYDKYLAPGYAAEQPWVEETDFRKLQAESDVISLHLPLTNETRHLANRTFFSACKKGCILINTARGACVDTTALVEALETGRLGGACLDVFENEKPHTYTQQEKALYDRLFALEQVVLSPHIAGWTVESKRLLATVVLDKLKILISNK